MRVGLVSTVDTNWGDDLVREGVMRLLRSALGTDAITWEVVNKHRPETIYSKLHPTRFLRRYGRDTALSRRAASWFASIGGSRFDGCDLVVQCGTPVLWPGCATAEWSRELWDEVIGRLSRNGIPALDLGAGSCYPWEKIPTAVEDTKDQQFLKRIGDYCRLNTVRESLAQKLWRSVGVEAPLLPCPAFFSAENVSSQPGEYVVLNYMEGGGHYDWGQGIDPSVWRDVFLKFVLNLKKQTPLLFICHDTKEMRLAESLDPTIPRYLPNSMPEYFHTLSKAKGGICNRLHAAVALAGLGIPAIGVGTDTRLLMLETLGLPALYVKGLSADALSSAWNALEKKTPLERERLRTLREVTRKESVQRLQEVLK